MERQSAIANGRNPTQGAWKARQVPLFACMVFGKAQAAAWAGMPVNQCLPLFALGLSLFAVGHGMRSGNLSILAQASISLSH